MPKTQISDAGRRGLKYEILLKMQLVRFVPKQRFINLHYLSLTSQQDSRVEKCCGAHLPKPPVHITQYDGHVKTNEPNLQKVPVDVTSCVSVHLCLFSSVLCRVLVHSTLKE